ncbi:Large neutral amino acids transporter small subunit 1 [Aphelenchoides fujianensis]|nr:Large neutral amino acids transporter small subunit 1 [Aphelenchoides fujianensis]
MTAGGKQFDANITLNGLPTRRKLSFRPHGELPEEAKKLPEKEPLRDEGAIEQMELEPPGLRQTLTLWNGVSIIIGSIIGSGIFIAPTGVQKEAGSVGVSLLIWLLSGLFAAMGAWSYAELGTLIRRSGGDYSYILEAFGSFVGFMRFWIEAIVVRPCSVTIVACTFATYMLKPFYVDVDPPPYSMEGLAIVLIVFLTAINCASVRLSTLIQDSFTLAKVFALIAIICTGGFLLIRGQPEHLAAFRDPWANSTTDPGKLSLAFYQGLFAYQGWNYLNFVLEELKNPIRDLPLAIIISCSAVTLIYVLTNVALYTVIQPAEMNQSVAVALDFASRIWGPVAFVMPIFVACSTLGSANGVIFTSSRLFYVGAQEGQMPQLLTMVHSKTRTPIPAVLATGGLSLAFLSISSNVYALINYIQISYWLAIATAIASLFYFRITRPTAERPIKVFLLTPIVFFLGCVALVLIPIVGSPVDTAIGIAIMLTAVPVYLVFIAWQPTFLTNISGLSHRRRRVICWSLESITRFAQLKLGLGSAEEK